MIILARGLFIVLLSFSLSLQAAVVGKTVDYQVGDDNFQGYLAYKDDQAGKRPGVLVVHEWWGHNAYARKRADMLAEMGYTALALDMYGEGKEAQHPKEAKKFMQQVANNMAMAEKRFVAAMEVLKNHETVDAERIAAIGYCFGGGIVLEMARRGVDLLGVASFHGSLATENPAQPGDVKAKVIVFHGKADQFISEEVVAAFEKEMEEASVNYTLVSYSDVKHSFTNPQADELAEKFGLPLAYDKQADQHSWQRLQAFLQDIFSQAIPEAEQDSE